MMGEPRTIPYNHPAYLTPRGRNVHLAALVKQAVDKPVSAVGGILDLDQAEQILAAGQADIVAMSRPLACRPGRFPLKCLSNREEDVVPCIRWNECLVRVATFRPVRCAVNPVSGVETEYANLAPARAKKKVWPSAAAPGGIQAALTATARGHEVVLFEKEGRLGGNLVVASGPPFKDDMKRFLDYLLKQIEISNASALGDTCDCGRCGGGKPGTALVIAVGAEPAVPPIPGIKLPIVAWAQDVFTAKASVGETVVVAGGGCVGCEAALDLARQGKRVTIVEMMDQPALDFNFVNRPLLLELLDAEGVGRAGNRGRMHHRGRMHRDRLERSADQAACRYGSLTGDDPGTAPCPRASLLCADRPGDRGCVQAAPDSRRGEGGLRGSSGALDTRFASAAVREGRSTRRS